MSAELVAMITIGAADNFGPPVSTTHVLSSGVAGTMAANRSGLQWSTIRNLAMAWVLDVLPVRILPTPTFAAGLHHCSPLVKVLVRAADCPGSRRCTPSARLRRRPQQRGLL